MLCEAQVSAECWAGEARGAQCQGVLLGAGPGSLAASTSCWDFFLPCGFVCERPGKISVSCSDTVAYGRAPCTYHGQ